VGDVVNKEHDLFSIVAGVGDLATLPSTVVELLYLLKDPTVCASDVVRVLERDPAMTANVLKLSNSAFYGARRKVSNVQDALVMLGNRAVMTMAFATGMAPVLRRDLEGYGITRERFWSHSVFSAAAAAFAADRLGSGHFRCEAFTAGLVHDVGMLVIDPYLVRMGETVEGTGDHYDVTTIERDILGFDHCDAGALLAENWGFPPILAESIRHHHEPVLACEWPDIVRSVGVGNLAASAVELDMDPRTDEHLAHVLDRLDLEPEFVDRLRTDLAGDREDLVAAAVHPVHAPAV
jgi:HD-like signal output (HDOD) protein